MNFHNCVKMSTYKMCSVPMCNNNTLKCPEKLFIHVPKCPKRRKQWLELARRDLKCTSVKSTIYFCEDHFDLPNDMENFMEYSVLGSVRKKRMSSNCLPSKFECQPDRIKRTAPPQPRSAVSKRHRKDIIEEILTEENEIPFTSDLTSTAIFDCNTEDNLSSNFQDQAILVCPEVNYKAVQVCLTAKIRSKEIQTLNQTKDSSTSPIKIHVASTATSPFKINNSGLQPARLRNSGILFSNVKISASSSNSSSPSKHSQLNCFTSPSVNSSLICTSPGTDQETKYKNT